MPLSMQPEKIQITDRDIQYAEKVLFGRIKVFDRERKDFIKNLDTIDLQAVPGSGKTTALLAKLLILERYMPFDDGSGVLAISHTNRAVDAITENIAKYCPNLFSYPNFIGTIQSFVDQFLAIPCGHILLKTRLSWIDSDQFRTRLWNRFQGIYWDSAYEKPGTWFWSRHISEAKKQAKGDTQLEKDVCNQLIEKEVKDIFYDFNNGKIKRISDKENILVNANNKKFIAIKKIIDECISEGFISYEYAYNLAEYYLIKFPLIKKIIRKRFRHVFVDEMQDMDKHQHDLLEDLFYRKSVRRHVYQRIGDINQAIYSGEIKLENIWKKREKTLPLKGSHRLPPNIAQVVKCFGLTSMDIEGLRKDDDGNDIDIKPHIIVFDDQTIDQVIPEFAKIIKELNEEGKLPLKLKYPIKAVGWRKEHDEDDNLGIKDYHKSFENNEQNPKIDYSNFKSYLLFYEKKDAQTLRYIRNNILNALLKLLRLEEIRDEQGRNYTIERLFRYFMEKDKEGETKQVYEDFKLKILQWTKMVYQCKVEDTFKQIKEFIPDFLKYFDKDKKVIKSKEYIEWITGDYKEEIATSVNKACPNLSKSEDTDILIQTVHSVKGETHTATLYLETYYHKDGAGENAKSYESQRLVEQFKGAQLSENATDRVKQSARMVYVGFSRPTHLLCFAIHKKRFNQENFDNRWNIRNLSNEAVH
jgi:DNA helicase II / ATP-dependent DNA helicase PcrA